jgi:hypothetical protein
MLSLDAIRDKFYYCAATGALWMLCGDKHGKPSHYKVAGSYSSSDGRGRINYGGKKYALHRFIWFYVYGELPDSDIDHINGNPGDNRIANLRLANTRQNMENIRKATRRSKTGLLGVCKRAADRKYAAIIQIKGKQTHLGMFDTAEDAHQAYLNAKRIHHEYCTI